MKLREICILFCGYLILNCSFAFAGGCHLEIVSPEQEYYSIRMVSEIGSQISKIEKEMAEQGNELKVVLIARIGLDMDLFSVIKDDPNVQLEVYLNKLNDIIHDKIARTPPEKYRSDEKLLFSHFGFLVKSDKSVRNKLKQDYPNLEFSDWNYVNHLLSPCDGDDGDLRYGPSKIFAETANRFFWDTEFFKEKNPGNRTRVIVPSAQLQKNLHRLLMDPAKPYKQFHQEKYNVAATPFILHGKYPIDDNYHQLKDQNSNQWPLEMIAASAKKFGQITNRSKAQDFLMETNYRPTLLMQGKFEFSANGFKGGFAPDICDKNKAKIGGKVLWDATNVVDCTNQRFWRTGIFQIITVESILKYMTRAKLIDSDRYGNPRVYDISVPQEELKKFAQDATARREKAMEEIEKFNRKYAPRPNPNPDLNPNLNPVPNY